MFQSHPRLFFPLVCSQWIPLHTLCCISPFVQKHHPLNLGIILTTTIVAFGNLINLYPAHHADPVLWMFLAVMPVCRVSMHLLTDVVVDVRTCDVEGKAIFVSHAMRFLIVCCWYYIFISWGCTWCVRFVVHRCCHYVEPVGRSLLICWRRRCWVAMSWCWTLLFVSSTGMMGSVSTRWCFRDVWKLLILWGSAAPALPNLIVDY